MRQPASPRVSAASMATTLWPPDRGRDDVGAGAPTSRQWKTDPPRRGSRCGGGLGSAARSQSIGSATRCSDRRRRIGAAADGTRCGPVYRLRCHGAHTPPARHRHARGCASYAARGRRTALLLAAAVYSWKSACYSLRFILLLALPEVSVIPPPIANPVPDARRVARAGAVCCHQPSRERGGAEPH